MEFLLKKAGIDGAVLEYKIRLNGLAECNAGKNGQTSGLPRTETLRIHVMQVTHIFNLFNRLQNNHV